MLENGKLMEIIPFQWPTNQAERIILIENIKTELNYIISEQPWQLHQVRKIKENLACQGPYYELIEEFGDETKKPHKLQDILYQIHNNVGQRINLIQTLGSKRLQKLICDNYRIFGKNIFDYSAKLITFAQYLKINISTIKEIFNQHHIDQNTENLIGHMATRKCQIFSTMWNYINIDNEKYIHLFNSLKQIEEMQKPTTNNLNQYFNQQQIILCFILFSLFQCEQLIALNLGEKQSFYEQQDITFYTNNNTIDDCSLQIDIFPKIIDYFPKLGQKLIQRYKEVLKIPILDQNKRAQIFNYTQNLLGYENNFEINLDIEIISDIKKILSNQYQERNIGLVILVANAKMYTQLMYSLM